MRNQESINQLFEHLKSLANKDFKWGSNDCFIMTADVIKMQSGVDVAKPYRGKYRSLSGALKLVRNSGYKCFTDELDKHFQSISPLTAKRGDIIAYEHPGEFQEALAVCQGSEAFGLHPEKGIYPVEMSYWTKAWSIDK